MRFVVLVLLTVGCGDDGSTGDAGGADAGRADGGGEDAGPGETGATTLYAPPDDGPPGWLAVPYPHDLYLGDDGTLELDGTPTPVAAFRAAEEFFSAQRGFARHGVIAFPLEGALDRASVPGDAAPDTEGAASDAVLLMRLDGEGGFVPLFVEYSAFDAAVLLRPQYGHALARSTTYVAAITAALVADDGTPLAPAEAFALLRDEPTGGGPGVEEARAIVGPGLDALEAAGVDRASIVSATVFTTHDTTIHLAELGAVAEAAAVPVATLDRVFSAEDGTMDALLGTPVDDGPGFDTPAAGGDEGDWAQAHDALAFILTGTFESPRAVTHEGGVMGELRRDGEGAVTAGPTPETVPFVLAVPRDVDPASMPVVFAHVGNPNHRLLAMAWANVLARHGFATVSIDPFTMGARFLHATDEVHEARGAAGAGLGPDGFAEHVNADVAALQQLLSDAPGDAPPGHPGYVFGLQSQWIVDALVTLRFVREGDLTALAGAAPSLAGLSFDPDQVHFLGFSNGGYIGGSLPAAGARIEALATANSQANFIDLGCHAPDSAALLRAALGPLYGIRGSFDDVDRRLCMNPVYSFLWAPFEALSPSVTLRDAFESDAAEPPDLLVSVAAIDETIGTPAGSLMAAAARAHVAGAFPLVDLPEATLPASANLDTPGGAVTAVAQRVDMASHESLALRVGLIDHEFPIVAPFETLPEEIPIDNPIGPQLEQIARFFETRRDTGRATVEPLSP